MTKATIMSLATSIMNETQEIDFKEGLDVTSKGEWYEVIKDIIAMANSGGGALIIGVNDDGTISSYDPKPLLNVDSADVINKIFSVTGQNFSDFEILPLDRGGVEVAIIIIGSVLIPIVFNTAGNYQDQNGKTKTAFPKGGVYFRHGAKSEPCTSEDLRQFVEREVTRVKEFWLAGIRQVVEAPQGSTVLVVPSNKSFRHVKITNDETAIPVKLTDEDYEGWYDYKKLTGLLRSRYSDFVENQRYHTQRKALEGNPKFCQVRLLNPKNPKSSKKTFYTPEIIGEFDKTYTLIDER